MYYRIIADLVVLLHLMFIVFVVLGGFWVLRHRKWIVVHLPAVLWAGLLELNGWICPLTPLENRFRRLGESGGYSGGFIEHYLEPVIYPEALTRGIQIYIGIFVFVLNLGIYIWMMVRYKKLKETNSDI